MGIILLAVVLSGCQSNRFKLTNVAYGSDPQQRLDFYPALKYRTTFIIVLHGGGFIGGDKSDFSSIAQWFSSLGYPTANINYRLLPDGKYPKGVDDVLLAMEFLSHYGAQRFILYGHSAGAYLALLVMLAKNNEHTFGIEANYSAPIFSAIGTSGPYNYSRLSGKALEDYIAFADGSLEEANVIKYADTDDPSVLVIAGGQDTFVPWQCSEDLYHTLKNASYNLIPGAGHNDVIKPFDPAKPAFTSIKQFLTDITTGDFTE